ncbi:MAG: 50S ribosomal protein L30 [Thermoanaerobaculales bacterium]|jgi:large subunit ribosomal protein L30|nr:50S ribosomal protein L30 [Thermoanaerobaculales bacterium]
MTAEEKTNDVEEVEVEKTEAPAEEAAADKKAADSKPAAKKAPAKKKAAPKKKAASKKKTSMIKITQVKSGIGYQGRQKKVLAGLGLGKIGRSVTRKDDACIRGMVAKISHLVTVETVEG